MLSLKPQDVKRDDPRLYGSVVAYFGGYVETVKRVAYMPWALTSWTRELVIERLRSGRSHAHAARTVSPDAR